MTVDATLHAAILAAQAKSRELDRVAVGTYGAGHAEGFLEGLKRAYAIVAAASSAARNYRDDRREGDASTK